MALKSTHADRPHAFLLVYIVGSITIPEMGFSVRSPTTKSCIHGSISAALSPGLYHIHRNILERRSKCTGLPCPDVEQRHWRGEYIFVELGNGMTCIEKDGIVLPTWEEQIEERKAQTAQKIHTSLYEL